MCSGVKGGWPRLLLLGVIWCLRAQCHVTGGAVAPMQEAPEVHGLYSWSVKSHKGVLAIEYEGIKK